MKRILKAIEVNFYRLQDFRNCLPGSKTLGKSIFQLLFC